MDVSDPRVVSKLPLHGPNLFPEGHLGPTIIEWFDQMKNLGIALLRGVALGLGIDEDWFTKNIARDPTCLFRIFHDPPSKNP